MSVEYKYVGTRRPIIEGREKVTGHTRFLADLNLPGIAYGRPIFSPHAHANIVSVDKSEAEALPGVIAVLTAEDLPTKDKVIVSRRSLTLAKDKVLFVGAPVVLVVAESMIIAADAAELVDINYEPLPAVVDMMEAIKPESPKVWPNGLPKEPSDEGSSSSAEAEEEEKTPPKYNNVYGENHFERGDVAAGFAEADVVVEHEYLCEIVHQGYLEPHAAVTVPSPLDDGIDVYAAVQGKFWVRNELSKLLDMPLHKVRVHSVDVGGAFGGKLGTLDGLGASAAIALGRPVKIMLTRAEDFMTTTPTPRMQFRIKTGAKKDGTITAIEIESFNDNGVFMGGQGIMTGALLGGYYKCDNLKIDCWEVLTHKPHIGSYRAPVMPQSTFAFESNIDEMAAALDIDPLQFRLNNVAETGDPIGVGRPWPSLGLKECLQALVDHPLWTETLNDNEGIGLAIGAWWTAVNPADATIRVDSNGIVYVETGHVDLTSNNSAFVLIVAEALGVLPDDVLFVQNGTAGAYAPVSGASRLTYSVSGAVKDAAEKAAKQVRDVAADMLEASPDDLELIDSEVHVKGVPDKTVKLSAVGKTAREKLGGTGPIVAEGKSALPGASPTAAAHLVKVHVDPRTGKVTPLHYVCAQDVGFALNPLLVEGQMHGGMAQGLGFALHEAMIYDEAGNLMTGSFLDYDLPHADQMPPLEAIQVENPSPIGTYGMRGVAEPPIIGGAAAVGNAIKNAVGVRPTQLPIRAEQVWCQLQ